MKKAAHRLGFAGAAFAWLAVAACAPEVPYFGPKDADHATGYTDEKLDQNRFRVTYSGNSQTNRETVEDFLLLRSAQVTEQSGSHFFMFDMRDTKSHTTYFSDFRAGAAPAITAGIGTTGPRTGSTTKSKAVRSRAIRPMRKSFC